MKAKRSGYRAGDRAELTKCLKGFIEARGEDERHAWAVRAANVINRAPPKGFTKEEIINGRAIPNEILALIENGRPEPTAGADGSEKVIEQAKKITFALEKALQQALRSNIAQIDPNCGLWTAERKKRCHPAEGRTF